MALAMVATALAPMIVTAYYNLSSAQDYVADVELRNLEQLATSTAGRISQLIADFHGLADYVGTDDDFVDYLAHPTPKGQLDTLAKLKGLARANPDIQFVMVMDHGGTAIVSTDPDVAGKNFKFREYFQQAMEGHSYMTGIIVGSVAGAAGVFFSRPVFAPGTQDVTGVVVMRVKADAIARILSAARVRDDRLPFLVDGEGVIVWHPDERFLFKSLVPLKKEVLDEIVADQRFRRSKIESIQQPELAEVMVNTKDRGHVEYMSHVTRREEIAGYAPVPLNDWVVGVSESRDYFAKPLDRLFDRVVVSVLLAGAIFVALALIFARSIVRPIQALTEAANALKNGDYDNANIEVRSNDEVGQLARTFNVMIDVLRQRERERSGRGASIGFDKEP